MSPPSLKWGWWYSQPSRRSQVPASKVAQSQPAFVSQSFWHCSDEAWYGALSEVPSPCFKLWNSTKTFASARPMQRAAKRAHGASGRPAMLSTRLIHRNGRDCWALCWAFYAVSWNVMIVKYSRSNTRWLIRLDFSSLSIVSQQAELEWVKWMRTMRTMRWEPDLLLGALACSSDATAIMLPCGACALLSLNLGIFVASNRPLTMLDPSWLSVTDSEGIHKWKLCGGLDDWNLTGLQAVQEGFLSISHSNGLIWYVTLIYVQ